MELRAIPLPGNDRIVAFVYGPIVLAGALGSEGIPPGGDLNVNERLYGAVLNTSIHATDVDGRSRYASQASQTYRTAANLRHPSKRTVDQRQTGAVLQDRTRALRDLLEACPRTGSAKHNVRTKAVPLSAEGLTMERGGRRLAQLSFETVGDGSQQTCC